MDRATNMIPTSTQRSVEANLRTLRTVSGVSSKPPVEYRAGQIPIEEHTGIQAGINREDALRFAHDLVGALKNALYLDCMEQISDHIGSLGRDGNPLLPLLYDALKSELQTTEAVPTAHLEVATGFRNLYILIAMTRINQTDPLTLQAVEDRLNFEGRPVISLLLKMPMEVSLPIIERFLLKDDALQRPSEILHWLLMTLKSSDLRKRITPSTYKQLMRDGGAICVLAKDLLSERGEPTTEACNTVKADAVPSESNIQDRMKQYEDSLRAEGWPLATIELPDKFSGTFGIYVHRRLTDVEAKGRSFTYNVPSTGALEVTEGWLNVAFRFSGSDKDNKSIPFPLAVYIANSSGAPLGSEEFKCDWVNRQWMEQNGNESHSKQHTIGIISV